MKNILNTILILTQILWVTPAKAALSDPDKAIVAHNNLLANGGFENGKAGHVATTGVLTIDTTNFIEGKQSGLMTFTSATGDLQYNVASGQNSGMNMTATCKVKTAATSIQFCGMANGVETSCVSVPSNNTWSPMAINFVGPTNGQNVGYKIKNTSASGTITFNADGCDVYTGSTTSVAQAVLFGLVKITGCAGSFQKAAAGSTLVAYTAQTGCSYAVEGNAVADTSFGSTQLPAIKFSSMPAGEYKIEYEGTIGANGSSGTVQTNQFTDGTTTAREISTIVEAAVATGQANGISQSFAYTAPKTNVTWQLFSAVSDANNTQVFGTTAKPGVIRVYYFPSSQSQVINPNVTPASWSGTSTLSGTTTSATMDDPVSVTGAVTTTASRNMSCVTNASSKIGIDCTMPRIGNYLVCYTGYTNGGTNSPGGQLTDGSGSVIVGKFQGNGSSSTSAGGGCASYNVTSLASPTTFKMQAQVNGATVTANATSFSVVELDAAMPSPVLSGAQFAASAWVSAGTFNASTTIPTNFDSIEYDDSGCITTSPTAWKYTAKSAGVYQVSASLYSTSTTNFDLYKNGTLIRGLTYNISSSNGNSASAQIKLNVGDYIDIRTSGSVNVVGGALTSHNTSVMSIVKVSN